MFEAAETDLPVHHSAAEILAHPRFRTARNAMLEAMLSRYEHEPFLNRLLLDARRSVLFGVIMCLDARCDDTDPATWTTLRLVKQAMAAFRLASPRCIADLVSRLIKTGYLKQVSSPRDRRIRILRPTAKMIAQDQDWLVSHYVPLQVLFPDPGYAPIMQRDPNFQRAQRLAASHFFALEAQMMARNPTMMQFMMREAGMMILIKLLQLAGPTDDTTREISYSDIGARFGVSRTQVRKLLQDAEKAGLMRLTPGRHHCVQLTPTLIDAFDRFIADTMAGHDLVFNVAQRAAAAPKRFSGSMQSVPLLDRAAPN
jgi:DNA-binding MarR family transcriptional regulator